ncbi:hypothetical protein Holit_02567 [Hollandina sp. SP2]
MAKKSAQIIEIRKMVGETGLVIIEQVNPGPVREPFNVKVMLIPLQRPPS